MRAVREKVLDAGSDSMPMQINEELFRGGFRCCLSRLSLSFAVCVSVSLSSIVCNTLLRNGPGEHNGVQKARSLV